MDRRPRRRRKRRLQHTFLLASNLPRHIIHRRHHRPLHRGLLRLLRHNNSRLSHRRRTRPKSHLRTHSVFHHHPMHCHLHTDCSTPPPTCTILRFHHSMAMLLTPLTMDACTLGKQHGQLEKGIRRIWRSSSNSIHTHTNRSCGRPTRCLAAPLHDRFGSRQKKTGPGGFLYPRPPFPPSPRKSNKGFVFRP